MISTTLVDRLIETGRQQGGLEVNDIRRALPVDTMSAEELAEVLARVEEAGISVEIDSALLTPRHRNLMPHLTPATGPKLDSGQATKAHDRLTNLAFSIKKAGESSYTGRPTQGSLQKPATIFVIAAAMVLVLLALVVWRFA